MYAPQLRIEETSMYEQAIVMYLLRFYGGPCSWQLEMGVIGWKWTAHRRCLATAAVS